MSSFEFTVWIVPYVAMILSTAGIGAVAWRNRRQTGAPGLVGDQFGLFSMASAVLGMLILTDPALKVLSWKLMWVASVPTALGWTHMALAYADSKHLINRYTAPVAVGIGMTFILSLFAPPTAEMVLKDYEMVAGTLTVEVGWLFWLFFGGFGVLFTIASVELVRTFRKQPAFGVQIFLILTGIIITFTLHALYPLQLFPIEIGPLGSLIKTVLFLTSIYWFGMLDVAPVAREELVDNMDDAVIVINENNHIVDSNAAAERLATDATANRLSTGEKGTALIGKPLSETLGEHGDTLAEYVALADDVETGENTETHALVQKEITLSNGNETRHYDLVISPVTSRGGDKRGKLIVLRDITERKRREAKLEERERDLETLNRILRHDIRNEMNVVVGYSDAVKTQVDGQLDDRMEKVQNSAENVIEITEDVRDLMQAMLEEDDSDLEAVKLGETIESEVESTRAAFENAEITFQNELPEETTVAATEMLSSVFKNLLTNAVVHNDKETPTINVQAFVAETQRETVVVEVADNGPGVPRNKREEIFGRGEKGLDSSGTGIGLYLVDTLIDQYDGTVDIRENDPDGAVFCVKLQKYDK